VSIKRMKRTLLIFSLFSVLAKASALLAETGGGFSSRADVYLTKLTNAEEFSGAVLVATNGHVLFAKAYGLANREHGIANATNTIFRLGSVTKQFTAACVLILQQEGKLSVSNLVSQYVEECPEAWKTITIHHLLGHTAGIPSFTEFPDDERFERLPTTTAATVARFKDKPLRFPPGTRMEYSNSHYVLLGYIIEKLSGTGYDQFVAEHIFRPLHMNASGYDHPAAILTNRAAGYSKGPSGIQNCTPYAMDTPHGAGALYSTVLDMLIWDESIYSRRLLSAESQHDMFTGGYGWAIRQENGHPVYWHPGGVSGFTSFVCRYPDQHVYFAVLSNFDWTDPVQLGTELRKLYFSSK
jgi:CubicO group peptidase (beta-lactamase class C family)